MDTHFKHGFVAAVSVAVLVLALYLIVLWAVASAGPGGADFEFVILGKYDLVRSNGSCRTLYLPGSQRPRPSISDTRLLGWNNRYVVCGQVPIDEWFREIGGLQWWIIDASANTTYGPFQEDAYKEKLEQLAIDPPIEVRNVEEYRNDALRRSLPSVPPRRPDDYHPPG